MSWFDRMQERDVVLRSKWRRVYWDGFMAGFLAASFVVAVVAAILLLP